MRSVLITSPVLLLGGTEIHMLELARCLAARNYRIQILAYHETDSAIVRKFNEVGIEVIAPGWARAQGVTGQLRLLFRLAGFFRRQRPAAVHVQYLAPGLIPILAARLAGVPVVFATVHIAGSVAYGWTARMLLRLAALFCTAFVCVSKGVERFWFGDASVLDPVRIQKGRRHFTIYNTVDAPAIEVAARSIDRARMKADLGLPEEAPVVGFVGRLTHQKGVPILLAAMAEVLQDFPDVRLLVVGDGPDREALRVEASRLGIAESIIWLGAQPPHRVLELLGVMDVLAAPSLFEGFGLMAAEALAAGVPVVASRVEGLTEVVASGECGLLVQAGDSTDLAGAINSVLSDATMRFNMGEVGRLRVKELFSGVRFSESWNAIYTHYLTLV